MTQAKIRFAVTGLNHGHIYGQTSSMLEAGAEGVCFYAPEDDLAAQFSTAFPQITRVEALEEILEDDQIVGRRAQIAITSGGQRRHPPRRDRIRQRQS